VSKKIKITFISPKGPLYRGKGGIFRKALRPGPITFPTLAALVPEDIEHEIEVLDEGIQDVDASKIETDLAAMTAITGSATRAYEMSAQLRERGIPVVIGGPHVTLAPEDAEPHVDTIVSGYAEETWPQLLRDFVSGEMKPRYDMAPDFSFDRPGNLPFPKREVLNKKQYRTLATFEATRGCVHDCDFCVVPHAWGRKPFLKPIDHVVEDIRRVGERRILFYDLNIIADRAYARQLFEALIPLKIRWVGLATALMGKDSHLMELAARSGCQGLLVGFESVSPDSLQGVHKRFNDPVTYTEFARDLQRLGIAINGTFAFGSDGDTKESFEQVIDFVLTHQIELPRFSVLAPFPGTKLYDRLESEGRILHKDWSLYDGQHVVFQPKNMAPEELLEGHERVWKKIYTMGSIGRRLKGKKKNFTLLWAVNMAYRYYANRLHKFYTCDGGVSCT